MPKYLVGFTVPVTADTPEKAAAQFREYFRVDRTLKVASTDGTLLTDTWYTDDNTVIFIEPPFTEGN
jgi:hypothetical protein